MIWRNWFPTPQQMSDAVQLRHNAYRNITMQQAMGMVFTLGLVAGLLPFLSNWIMAAQIGTVVPLALAARSAAEIPDLVFGLSGINAADLSEFYATVAGLPQPLPGWLAAGLSALGVWINGPLQWLGFWIVYGALVMLVDKAWGATMTLQRFYAATGYASIPLVLTGLSPISCIGNIAAFLGVVWAVAVYVRANQDITHFSLARSAAAIVLPGFILLLFGLLLFGLLLMTLVFAAF